jgi:hypothetical protein
MFISFGDGAATRLHQLTADAEVNADGEATLSLVPGIRSAPADNAEIEWSRPLVHLRLTSPVPSDIGLADVYRFSFTAEEAL